MIDRSSFGSLLAQALERRQGLIETLAREQTDAYRIFHGVAEGAPGLTIDRYAKLILVQTFREPLEPDSITTVEKALRAALPDLAFALAYNHRGKTAPQSFDEWHRPPPIALEEITVREFGAELLVRARHPGIDPWVFLDLRSGRRHLRERVLGKSVLNLFSYTCSVGIAAATAGASEVWNVDFAARSLDVGRRNAELNAIPKKCFRTIEEDCLPVMRQLAGLPAGGRRDKTRRFLKVEPRLFDFVFLDPPAWSKGSFGAIDVAGDYPSLFKSAVLAAKPEGGQIICTNHVASVDCEAWFDVLKRCAAKAGRPLRSIRRLTPDADFPSYDGNHPLKIAVCEV